MFRQEVYGLINNIKDNYTKNDDFQDYQNKLREELDELRKMLENFVTKPDFEAYKNATDNQLQSHTDSIADIYKILDELRNKLNDKLGTDNFDEHLVDYNNLKNLVIALSNRK